MSQSVENFLECPDIWNVFCAYNKCHHFANVTLQSGDADGSRYGSNKAAYARSARGAGHVVSLVCPTPLHKSNGFFMLPEKASI